MRMGEIKHKRVLCETFLQGWGAWAQFTGAKMMPHSREFLFGCVFDLGEWGVQMTQLNAEAQRQHQKELFVICPFACLIFTQFQLYRPWNSCDIVTLYANTDSQNCPQLGPKVDIELYESFADLLIYSSQHDSADYHYMTLFLMTSMSAPTTSNY